MPKAPRLASPSSSPSPTRFNDGLRSRDFDLLFSRSSSRTLSIRPRVALLDDSGKFFINLETGTVSLLMSDNESESSRLWLRDNVLAAPAGSNGSELPVPLSCEEDIADTKTASGYELLRLITCKNRGSQPRSIQRLWSRSGLTACCNPPSAIQTNTTTIDPANAAATNVYRATHCRTGCSNHGDR